MSAVERLLAEWDETDDAWLPEPERVMRDQLRNAIKADRGEWIDTDLGIEYLRYPADRCYKERWMEILSDDVHFKSARIFDTYDDFVAYHSDNPLTRHIPVEAVRILVEGTP